MSKVKKSDGSSITSQSFALESGLASDILRRIDEARSGLAATVNSALTLLYWRIGQRIHTEVLKGERAGYGEQIVYALSRQLSQTHLCSCRLGFTQRVQEPLRGNPTWLVGLTPHSPNARRVREPDLRNRW
jgi:hypothetical protein